MRKIYFFIALATMGVSLNAQEWTSVYKYDSFSEFYDLKFFDADNGYVIGGSGTTPVVLKTTDGGSTWVNKNTGLDGTLPQTLAFHDFNNGFVATTTGLYKTTNGGDAWTEVTSEINYEIFGVTYAGYYNEKHVYYAYGKDKMFKTTDFGTTWTVHYSSDYWMLLVAVLNPGQALEFYNENEFYFIYGSDDFEVYKFDGTEAYSFYTFNRSSSFACLSAISNEKVFASSGARLSVINNPGTDGQDDHKFTNALYIKGMGFNSNATIGYGVSSDGKIYRYQDGYFNNMEYDGTTQLNAVSYADDATVYAIGNNGIILKKQGINTQPEITSTAITEATVGIEYSYTLTATDADGDALAWQIETLPEWITITDHGDGSATLLGTPSDTNIGANNVSVYVSDGIDEYWQMFQIIVNEQAVNNIPEITSTAVTEAITGQEYAYMVTATDEDGDVLSWVGETLPDWLSLYDNNDGTATLSGTPGTAEIGNNDVVLKVSDGKDSHRQSFVISVENPTQINETLENIQVFPNPTAGNFIVNSSTVNILNIKLYSSNGQLLRNNIMSNMAINIKESGIYFLHIKTSDTIKVKKLIVY